MWVDEVRLIVAKYGLTEGDISDRDVWKNFVLDER